MQPSCGNTAPGLKAMLMFSWLAVKSFFKKVWAWCRKYWQLLLGLLIPCLIWLLTVGRNSYKMREVLDRVQEDHKKEIDVINSSYEEEKKARELAEKRYEEAVREAEKKFAEENLKLTQKKKNEIKKIIDEHSSDPAEITRQLADKLGLQIVISDG